MGDSIFWPGINNQIPDVECALAKKMGLKNSYDSTLLWHIIIFQQNLPHSIAQSKISLTRNIISHAPSLFSIIDSKSWYKMEIFEIFTQSDYEEEDLLNWNKSLNTQMLYVWA